MRERVDFLRCRHKPLCVHLMRRHELHRRVGGTSYAPAISTGVGLDRNQETAAPPRVTLTAP